MSQAEIIRKEPNLKRYTHEEKIAMIQRAIGLLDEGKKDEADILIGKVPLHWKSCKILKEMIGIDAMIANNTNLSEAVEHYGIEWLER